MMRYMPGGGGGEGGDSSINIPGCVCWGSENVPILKYALGKKMPILWCNIKLICMIPKDHS